MKKERLKGWLGLLGSLFLLFYIGGVYRASHFSAGFCLAFITGILAVPAVLLASYRRVGSLPSWATVAAALPTLLYATGDTATAILTWALTCGTPLAVSLYWPYVKKLLPMTAYALPTAGAFWMIGAWGYCKLHFGSWNLYCITERIAGRYARMVEQMEALYQQLYQQELPAPLGEAFDLLKTQSAVMGFYAVMMMAFALFGAFFLALWIADRAVKGAGWLGTWRVLLPGRGISWVFMLSYILIQFIGGTQAAALMAVIYLFGFFFVFAGVYWLLGLMRKKQWPAMAQGLLIGLLFLLAYCTVGGALLSPYTILMYLGWWIATLPKMQK